MTYTLTVRNADHTLAFQYIFHKPYDAAAIDHAKESMLLTGCQIGFLTSPHGHVKTVTSAIPPRHPPLFTWQHHP